MAKKKSRSKPAVYCRICGQPIEGQSAMFTIGVCPKCQDDGAGWNVIFDAEQGRGKIPENLRRAYGL